MEYNVLGLYHPETSPNIDLWPKLALRAEENNKIALVKDIELFMVIVRYYRGGSNSANI